MIPAPLVFLPLVLAEPADPRPLTDAETIERIPLPPTEYRGDINAEVHFVDPSKLPALCGMKVERWQTLLGCARWKPRQLFLSNPCLSLDQLWAKEACHEIGHLWNYAYPSERP